MTVREFTRREALAGATALGAFALAGCVAEEDNGEPSGVDEDVAETESNGGENSTDGQAAAADRADEERPTGESEADSNRDQRDSKSRDDEQESGDDNSGDSTKPTQGEDREEPVEGLVQGYSVQTTETGCTTGRVGTGRGQLVSQREGTVTVEGSLVTSTPCHDAVLNGVNYRDGELALAVAAESNLGPEEYCVQCVGEISYEATVSVAEGVEVERVSVAAEGVSGS